MRIQELGKFRRDERGAVLFTFTLIFIVLIGFTALAYEAGYWYLVRSELSKSVDAAALAGAANISNPYVDTAAIAREFGNENFPAGYLGTPADGADGSVQFEASMDSNSTVRVSGRVTALATLARLFGVDRVATAATGVAQKKEVEIMMILVRSGSMDGSAKIGRLKSAARSFVAYFADTQDEDRMGLITFATSVTVSSPLGTDYVTRMTNAINAMCPGNDCEGATNAEDALAQSDGPYGFSDQSGLPGDQRVQQFLIFFSDGMPTAFRGGFRQNNIHYDAVTCVTGNCRPGDTPDVYNNLGRPDREQWLGIDPLPTGDGRSTSGSGPTRCGAPYGRYLNTKWHIFESRPVPGYSAEHCSIPERNVYYHVCNLASAMTLENAQALKDKGIRIYTIGLGSSGTIDPAFLRALSSGSGYYYQTPDSSQLEEIFQQVAMQIKLRLVQ